MTSYKLLENQNKLFHLQSIYLWWLAIHIFRQIWTSNQNISQYIFIVIKFPLYELAYLMSSQNSLIHTFSNMFIWPQLVGKLQPCLYGNIAMKSNYAKYFYIFLNVRETTDNTIVSSTYMILCESYYNVHCFVFKPKAR